MDMSSLSRAIAGPSRQGPLARAMARAMALAMTAFMSALTGTPTAAYRSSAMGGAGADAACTSRTSDAGTLSVCPGEAPVGSRVTVYAHGCKGASLVFLGPLDYIGSGGGGETLPGAVTNTNGAEAVKTFVVPLKYLAGGNLGTTVAVSAAGQYQFGSYPADECRVPFIVTTPPGTTTVIYNPFSPTGLTPGVHVTAQAAGTCLQEPAPVELRDYYRCFTTATSKTPGGSFVLDPCFSGPRGTSHVPAEMICPTDPATGHVVRLAATSVVPGPDTHPSGPRPQPAPAGAVAPWAFELADGQVCQLVDAAWGGLGPYSCEGGMPNAKAKGPGPAPSAPAWLIASYRTVHCHAGQLGAR